MTADSEVNAIKARYEFLVFVPRGSVRGDAVEDNLLVVALYVAERQFSDSDVLTVDFLDAP